MDKYSTLEPALRYLKKNPNTFGLTSQKLLNRSLNVSANTDSTISFEIERHHPVGGSQYTKGVGMSALITQRYKYRFNPRTEAFTQEAIGEPTWNDKEWNWTRLAEENMFEMIGFSFEEVAPGKFNFSDSGSGFSTIVDTKDAATKAFREHMKNWDFSLSFENMDGLHEHTKRFLCKRLKDECIKYVDDPINFAWSDRDLIEED